MAEQLGEPAGALWEEAAECGVCGSRASTRIRSINRRRFVACVECGVHRLYDRVAQHRLDLLYNSYYENADPSPPELERQLANPTFRHRRARLDQYLGKREKRLLEIGCGDGNFLAVLRRAGWDVSGLEFSADTSALVERRHGIPMFTGGLDDVVSDRPFAAVGAYHVFEHVYNPAAWMQRVRQLIEPKGLLHLQVPNAASLTGRLAGDASASLVFPQHVYFYTPDTLQSVLTRFGFVPLTVTTWDPWHGPGTVARTIYNVAHRALTGRPTWTDQLVGRPPHSDAPAAAVARHPVKVVLRGGLQRASTALAHVEAALGRGAVVDIVARRD